MQEPDATVENGAPRSPITPVHDDLPAPPPPVAPPDPLSPALGRPSQDEAARKAVNDVLYSDVCGSSLVPASSERFGAASHALGSSWGLHRCNRIEWHWD